MRVTLEQWRMLQAVVEHGGFAQAADAVHKSQSSINAAVHKLQQQLGIQLLQVQGRKAELTDAGKVLLRHAEQLLQHAADIEALAQGLAQGQPAEVHLAVDEVFPPDVLAQALAGFSLQFPNTRVVLRETVLSGGVGLFQAGEVQLLISGEVRGLLGQHILSTDFVAVAHPQHPLHQLGRAVHQEDLQRHRQIVVRDSGAKNIDSGWLLPQQRWTVSHIASSIDMISRQLGFAWLPMTRIQEALAQGLLKPLPLQAGLSREVALYLYQADVASGSVTDALLAELQKAIAPQLRRYRFAEQ